MRLGDAPETLTCARVIVAGPSFDYATEPPTVSTGIEATFMLAADIWNGTNHMKIDWDGRVTSALDQYRATLQLSTDRYRPGADRPRRQGQGEAGQNLLRRRCTSPALSRQQVVKFCEAVERDSSGIVKTIEIQLNRATGEGLPDPGKEDGKVTGDKYKGTIVFGLRVVE